jgi:hypothetical protein
LVDVPLTDAQALGDLNVVVVGWNDAVASVMAVTDLAGNQYLRAVGPQSLFDPGLNLGVSQSIYYAENIKAAAPGANVVSARFSQPAGNPDIRVLEYSGLQSKGALDAAAGATGTDLNVSSGAAATRSANELIFGADTLTAATISPGAGFTERLLTKPDDDMAEDLLVSAAGTFDASFLTNGSAAVWVMQMATFRVAGGP